MVDFFENYTKKNWFFERDNFGRLQGKPDTGIPADVVKMQNLISFSDPAWGSYKQFLLSRDWNEVGSNFFREKSESKKLAAPEIGNSRLPLFIIEIGVKMIGRVPTHARIYTLTHTYTRSHLHTRTHTLHVHTLKHLYSHAPSHPHIP